MRQLDWTIYLVTLEYNTIPLDGQRQQKSIQVHYDAITIITWESVLEIITDCYTHAFNIKSNEEIKVYSNVSPVILKFVKELCLVIKLQKYKYSYIIRI